MKEIFQKLLFLWFTDSKYHPDKWWHRLFSVLYVGSTIVVSAVTGLISLGSSVQLTNSNSLISTSLRDFTISKETSRENSIPLFLQLEGESGCFTSGDGKITRISEYELSKGYCNPDLSSNLNSALAHLSNEHPYQDTYKDKELMKNILETSMQGDEGKRYCFISNKDVDCRISNIVKYQRMPLYYFELFLKSLLIWFVVTMSWEVIWLTIYYKAVLYIMLGNKWDKKES